MKRILTLILIANTICSIAQTSETIEISDVKTTVIYFPEDIKNVDVGFPDDFDKNYEGKIVKITALSLFNYTTNLTVTTLSGIYGFDIDYKENPTKKYYTIEPTSKAIIFKEPLLKGNEKKEDIQNKDQSNTTIVNHILAIDKDSYLQYKSEQLVYFVLNGTYIKNDKIYFHFTIDNRSAIDYDIDFISLKNVSTKRSGKRAAKEQYDINYIPYALCEKVKVAEKKSFVIEINKLTLEKKTKLKIGIHELEGGRDGIFNYTEKDFKNIKPIH